jgi:predicted chitinase
MAEITPNDFINFFKYYKDEKHQQEAVLELYRSLDLASKDESAKWITTYRTKPEPVATKGICTAKLMEELTGHKASSFDSVFVNDCNRLFADTGFDKHLEAMQMLMANMMHETCNFVYMKEIASGADYNGRTDLGNTSPGDGEKYKGAGVLQLTGKYNYSRLADGINDPKVMDGVDYVSNTYPFTSARIWIEENDLLNICLTEGFDACCLKINGGWNGYEDRLTKYCECRAYMV